MTDKILVFVSCASAAEASRIARVLVDKRLVACASLGSPFQSVFTWKGERQEMTEFPLTLKTGQSHFAEMEAEIRRLHSYENPEIIAVPLAVASASYLQWIDESTGPAAG